MLLICTGTESTLFFTLIFLPKFLFVFLFLYLVSFSLRSSVEQLLTINGCSSGEWMMLRLLFPRVCHKNSVSMTQPILWKWPETSKSFQVARLCYKDNTCSLAQCLTIIWWVTSFWSVFKRVMTKKTLDFSFFKRQKKEHFLI